MSEIFLFLLTFLFFRSLDYLYYSLLIMAGDKNLSSFMWKAAGVGIKLWDTVTQRLTCFFILLSLSQLVLSAVSFRLGKM